MKPFLFSTLIVASGSLIAAAPAQDCKDGWCQGGCDEKRCVRVKVLSKSDPIVTVILSNNRGIGKAEYNCGDYKYRFIRDDQSKSDWKQTVKGSAARKTAEVACKR